MDPIRESASISLLRADADDKETMKVAWIAALVFHFLLFITVFPSMGGQTFTPEQRDTVVIKRYKPPAPPKDQPKKKVVKKSASRVPIPDPTPDEPEPIVAEEVEFVEDTDAPVDTDFLVGLPAGGPPSLAPEGPVRAGVDVQRPEKIVDVDPVYPELARRARKEGFVVLDAIIDKQGNVIDLTVLRPDVLGLTEAAQEAVRQWKYTPTYFNGRPVEVRLTITVQFQLSG
ncbi:MAG: energy transducer TonB [Acidobacteriota bacterium]|jgi:protein TonB